MFPAFCRTRLAVLHDYRYFLRIGPAHADNVYALVWAERCLALALYGQGVDVAVLTQAPTGVAVDDADLPVPVARIPYTRNVARRYARCLGALRGHLERFQPDCLWTTNGMATRVAGLMGRLSCVLITCARASDIPSRPPARPPRRPVHGPPPPPPSPCIMLVLIPRRSAACSSSSHGEL